MMKNLLCVKSILTITVCVAFSILTFLDPKEFGETMKALVTTIATFYFSHQVDKNNKNGGN